MTTRRTCLLRSLTSVFAVVAVVTTLGSVPKARAEFFMTDGNSPSILVTKREIASEKPPEHGVAASAQARPDKCSCIAVCPPHEAA